MKKAKKPVVNTRTMGINMSKTMFADIEARSKIMKISKSLYCKTILGRWLESGMALKIEG